MEHFYDEFSKSLAASVPRRESLRRMGAVLAGAVLSPLGLGTAWARGQGPDPCKAFCNRCPKQQRSQCLAACQACNGDTSRVCGSCGSYACCATGTSCCGGYCADLANDFYHCGSCAPCRAPALYEDGACVGGTCDYRCINGAVDCNGRCTPVHSDPNNCGACGKVCAAPTPYCNQGACSVCLPGLADCGGGNCADLAYDNANCGACGIVCPALAPYCNEGICSSSDPHAPCPYAWQTRCYYNSGLPGGLLDRSSCHDLQHDLTHCGACGNACPSYYTCTAGVCEPAEPVEW